MQECRDAGMKPLDLIWVDTDKCVDPTRKKIRSRLCAREYKTKKQGKNQRALPASQNFSAMPPLEAVKVLVSIMMSVSLSEKGKPLKLRHYDISSVLFQGTPQRPYLYQTSCRGSSEVWRRQSWQIGQERVWNSRCFPHLATWLREPDLWRIRRLPKRQTQRRTVSQSKSRCENGSTWRRLVCLSDDDGLKQIDSLLQIQIHSERHGNTWIRRFRREKPSNVVSYIRTY